MENAHSADEGGNMMAARCCIVGGGPAGMMLGFLLARAGVNVVVLEKHADFLRDFRGDTVHPATLELMHELGLLAAFLERPHQEARELTAHLDGQVVPIADLSHLPTQCKFLALMPQWEFLNFLAEQGRRYGGFHLFMEAEVTGLIEEQGRVVGVRAQTPSGPLAVRAPLTVGCDGRHSTVQRLAGFTRRDLGAPMDVLWMRLSRQPGDGAQVLGYAHGGHILILLDRGEYWQCGLVIPKGGFAALQQAGLEAFRKKIAEIVPELAGRTAELASWEQVKLLTVSVDRLERWHRAGVLCIGDAAHTMSPVGGVGINLAIQDAVAAANLLWKRLLMGAGPSAAKPRDPLMLGAVSDADLRRVQARRMFAVTMTQAAQVFVQNRVITRVLEGGARTAPARLPLALRALQRWPRLRRLPARLIGLGVRQEHVRSPAGGATTGA